MIVFFNSLFLFVSIVFFFGRLYEMLNLVNVENGFIMSSAIVTNPMMIAIVFIIISCCGTIFFSQQKQDNKKHKIPMGIFGFAIAVLLISSSALKLLEIFTVTGGFIGTDIAIILGSFGFAFFSVSGIRGDKKEKIPFILTMLVPMALCLNCVLSGVKSIHNTIYMYNCLAAIVNLLFMIQIFKYVYLPKKSSKMVLYSCSLMNFLFSCVITLANLIGGMLKHIFVTYDILLSLAYIMLGMYSLMIAFYILPKKVLVSEASSKNKPKKQYVNDEENLYDEDTKIYKSDDEDYSISKLYNIKPSEEVKENDKEKNIDFDLTTETDYESVEKFSQETIAALFAQKEEKEKKETKRVLRKTDDANFENTIQIKEKNNSYDTKILKKTEDNILEDTVQIEEKSNNYGTKILKNIDNNTLENTMQIKEKNNSYDTKIFKKTYKASDSSSKGKVVYKANKK